MGTQVRYVKPYVTSMKTEVGVVELLWGDRVVVTGDASGGKVKVKARALAGEMKSADLMTENPLLEVYIIDVGQGDAVLFRTPDDKWHLVDAGAPAGTQQTQKGAINFLRWKFLEDLERSSIELESLILSHPDSDHYGGLKDLLNGTAPTRKGVIPVEIKHFYHSGLGDYRADAVSLVDEHLACVPPGSPTVAAQGKFITELLGDATTFAAPPFTYSKGYAEVAALIADRDWTVERTGKDQGHLPGYGPGSLPGVEIEVLGPVIEQLSNGGWGLRYFTDYGKTKNGHSVVLRLTYGGVRMLLAGDLNEESQPLLMAYVGADEFRADVAKACHHGSDKVTQAFVAAIAARATVISSGDNESFAHPRPALMGLAGNVGRSSKTPTGEVVPPLVYSTELARSIQLGKLDKMTLPEDGKKEPKLADVTVSTKAWREKGHTESTKNRSLADVLVASELIYGLINVRTDGRDVLFATRKEAGNTYDHQVIRCP